MRIAVDYPMDGPPQEPAKQPEFLYRLMVGIGQVFTRIGRAINGQLTLGDGTDVDNLKGIWIAYTSNATPDTEDTIAHNTGLVPVAYWIFNPDKAGDVYKGTTAWTSANIYLKCSVASLTCKLFLILPPTAES